jgi:hypothetical protein
VKVRIDGQWTGLAYSEGALRYVDHFSSPDHWEFGFDVVYRLVFYTIDERVIDGFKAAFIEAFGLPRDHYDTHQAVAIGGSVFWRVYWDQESFDLRLLGKCDRCLDVAAERYDERVVILEVAIIPRSRQLIAQEILFNK